MQYFTQQALYVETTSIQRWFNIKTLNQCWIDVVSTLCVRGENIGPTLQRYHLSQRMTKPTIRRVTSKDSDQPIHPPNMVSFLFSSLYSLEAVEGTCEQRRLWSDCANAQADLRLRWSHKPYCRFYRALLKLCRVAIKNICYCKESFNAAEWYERKGLFYSYFLIWICTVCKGRVYPGSAGQELTLKLF